MNRISRGKMIWLLPLIMQLCFLGWLTFTRHVQMIDCDAAKLYSHAAAIWDAKTLLVPDWRYITTMELDCALLFALPFYGVTKDLLVSFACADGILYLLWTALCFALAARLLPKEKAFKGGVLGSLLLLTPYSIGVLQYANMMYLSGAQYSIKVMLPLLLIWLLLEQNPSSPPWYSWGLLVVYLAGCVLTAMSSGIYVAAMGLAPVLMVFAWGWLWERFRLTLYTLLISFGSVVATLMGLVTARIEGISIKGGKMLLASDGNLADNVKNCVVGIFRLMGAVAGEVSVTRLSGMAQLVCYGICVGLIVVLLHSIVEAVNKPQNEQTMQTWYFTMPAVWNLSLLCIMDTRYGDAHFEIRYHLIWVVPLLILLAVKAVCRVSIETGRVKHFLQAAGVVLTCFLILLCDRRAMVACNPASYEGENARVLELCEYIAQLDTQNTQEVYVALASHAAEMGAVLDPSHTYKTIGFSEGAWQLTTYDGALSSLDVEPSHRPALLVLREDTALDDLPAYLQRAEYVAQVNLYSIYYLEDGSLLDGVVGLPYHGGTGTDYPDSVGYNYAGTVGTDRSLTTDPQGGKVLESPALTMTMPVDITLNWTPIAGQDASGYAVLSCGENEISRLPLQNSEVTFEGVPAGHEYKLTVEVEGGSVVINSISFVVK